MSSGRIAPKAVPLPRRAQSPVRQDGSRTTAPVTPPRRPSPRVGHATDTGSFRNADGEAVSRPAEPPQQVRRNEPPPVRRSTTPLQPSRAPLPPVRTQPTTQPLQAVQSSLVVSERPPEEPMPTGREQRHFSSRDGELQVPPEPSALPSNQQQKHSLVADRQPRAVGLQEEHQRAQPSSSSRIPIEYPIGPSREVSMQQQSIQQKQKPQSHIPSDAIHRALDDSMNVPLVVDLRQPLSAEQHTSAHQSFSSAACRRPSTLGDSPSSPPAGRRSVLAPTHTHTYDVRHAHLNISPGSTVRTHLPGEHQSANSFCFLTSSQGTPQRAGEPLVDNSHQAVLSNSNMTAGAVRLSSRTLPEKPAPPPFIQPSVTRPVDPNATYAPLAARWEYLEQAPEAAPSTHQPSTDDGPPLVEVVCVVQVVCSELHFAGSDEFDPVPEVRLRLCDVGSMTVRRLTDLIHVSLNFTPLHRGVIRCYRAENFPGIISGVVRDSNCVKFTPPDSSISAFVDVRSLAKLQGERVLRLRWVEDGHDGDGCPSSSSVHVALPHAVDTRARTSALKQSAAGVSFGGFRVEKLADSDPLLRAQQRAMAGIATTDIPPKMPSAAVPFTLHAPGEHSVPDPIPMLVVPSRSNSNTSTPHVSPVRRTPSQTPGAVASKPYEVQTEHLISAFEGVRRFGQPVLMAPAPSASRPSSLEFDELPRHEPTAATHQKSTKLPIRGSENVCGGLDDGRVDSKASSSRGSSIVVDGVCYTPTTLRTQQLAEEIAALRSAIFSEDQQLSKSKGQLKAARSTPQPKATDGL